MNDLGVREIREKASISGGQHGKLITTDKDSNKNGIRKEIPAEALKNHTRIQKGNSSPHPTNKISCSCYPCYHFFVNKLYLIPAIPYHFQPEGVAMAPVPKTSP